MRIAPFALERFFAQHEFTAPHLLCTSDCESMSLRELLALSPGADSRFMDLHLGYTESQGDPELRQSISSLYADTGPEHILVHTGAEEAIFTFMNALLSPGDEVIVHTPCYQSLTELPKAIGCMVRPWPALPENGWRPDLEALQDLLNSRTRAVVVNTPHNPTGWHMDAPFQERLVELCAAHKVHLFSDEVYRFLEFEPSTTLPGACDLYERAVSLGVMSKSFGLAGLRIGWAATRDEELFRAMASYKDYTTICNPAPSEFLARIALEHKDEVLARTRTLCRDNLALLDAFFDRHGESLSWVRPRGGSICFPSLADNGDASEFCARVLALSGVLLAPAEAFQFDGPHFRIGYGRASLAASLEQLDNCLADIA